MKLGVIGGTGVYQLDGLENPKHLNVETPFGHPSDSLIHAMYEGHDVVFLPRHGKGHRILPSEINHRANIYAMKEAGVEAILSISAVGSLREQYKPGDIVFPDQYIDRTKSSERHTFFGNGIVAHISFADPTCEQLRNQACKIARETAGHEIGVFEGGTYLNMEGPAFSTRAESHMYRQLGCDIIGMTSLAEAKLAREAEICYACMATVTDYDCWREGEEEVSVQTVLKVLADNSARAKTILQHVIRGLLLSPDCSCRHALANAICTERILIPDRTVGQLGVIISKYM